MKLAYKTLRLIQDGKVIVEQRELKPKIIILVGSSGVGKSTLLHAISGARLEAFLPVNSLSYRLRLKHANDLLPEVEIGHSRISCTRYPAVYSPEGKSFSYIDMPGFADTGDLDADNTAIVAQDIANSYFRNLITNKAIAIKVVLTVTHKDLDERTQTFLDCLKDFVNFIQGVNAGVEELAQIKPAISLIVTKVNSFNRVSELEEDIVSLRDLLNNQKNDLLAQNKTKVRLQKKLAEFEVLKKSTYNVKETVKDSLKNFVEQTPELKNNIELKKIREVLLDILKNERFAVFTTPTCPGDKDDMEAGYIKDLIEGRTEFVAKEYAKPRAIIAAKHAQVLSQEINTFSYIGASLTTVAGEEIAKKMQMAFLDGDEEALKELVQACLIVNNQIPRRLPEFIHDLRMFQLSQATLAKYKHFAQLMTFFYGLLLPMDKAKYLDLRQWSMELGLYPKLNEYINSIKSVLRQNLVEFSNGTLIFTGYFLKTSQAIKEIKKAKQDKNVLHIVLLGLHTIAIDSDITQSNVNVSLVSPNIVITGKRCINLSGFDGKINYNSPSAKKGNDGVAGAVVPPNRHGNHGGTGNRGEDGLVGAPGAGAGNLLAICAVMQNQQNLEVCLNGGNGIKGQNGGDGGKGGDGSFPTKNGKIRFNRGMEWERIFTLNPTNSWERDYCRLRGGDAGCGGDAGLGGKGGDAGKKGQCVIIVGDSKIDLGKNLQAQDGSLGADGASGEPGNGGVHGKHLLAVHEAHPFRYLERGTANNGNKSVGINSTNWKRASIVTAQDFALQLIDYQIMLEMESIKHASVVGNFLDSFQNICAKISANVLSTTTDNLLTEANLLERYVSERGDKDVNFTRLYNSLLARITNVMHSVSYDTPEYKVLDYLYVSTLGNIARINALHDNLLVIDIHGHVSHLVHGGLAKLNAFKANDLRAQYSGRYKDQIDIKLKEAQKFIKILNEDIINQQQAVESQIAQLISEVNSAKDHSNAQIRSLHDKKRELKKARRKKMFLGIADIVIKAAGMIPPYGPMVATVANRGLAMVNNPSANTVFEFAGSVYDMKVKLKAMAEEEKKDEQQSKHVSMFKKSIEVAQIAMPLIYTAKELLEHRAEDAALMRNLDAQIASIQAHIQWLDEYLITMPSVVKDFWEKTIDDVQNFQSGLPNKTLASLAFSKFEVRQIFEGVKQYIAITVGAFSASEGFNSVAIKMNEAIDMSVNISNIIQQYQEHIVFASHLEELQSATVENVDVGVKYLAQVKKLQTNIQENIVRAEYYRVLTTFKQWVFPFAEKYLDLQNVDKADYDTIKQNLSHILDTIVQCKTSMLSLDRAVEHRKFDAKTSDRPAFFSWSYVDYPELMDSLLKGQKVIFTADIKGAVDAVKFKTIGINLQCQDKQDQLNKILYDLRVILKHSGISYGKYGENIYQIAAGNPLEIMYSFKTEDKIPVIFNGVWKKLQAGDVMLSPYTSWTIGLEPLDDAYKPDAIQYVTNAFKGFFTNQNKMKLRLDLVGDGINVNRSKISGILHLHGYKKDRYFKLLDNATQKFFDKEFNVGSQDQKSARQEKMGFTAKL